MDQKNGSSLLVSPTDFVEESGALSMECLEAEPYTLQRRVTRSILYTLAMVVSLFGNAMVICVVRRNSQMRNVTHRLIVNMAVADLLITAFHMPFRLKVQITHEYDIMVGGAIGVLICKTVGFSQDVSISSSVLSLMAIAVDRFIAVIFPLQRTISLHRARYAVIPIWIVSVCICAPLLYSTRLELYEGKFYCYEDWSPLFDSVTAGRDYTLAQFLLLYTLPLIVIISLYSCVVFKVWHRSIPGQAGTAHDRRRCRAKKKLLRMLIIVVCLFAVCWLPYHVAHFLQFFNDKYRYCPLPETLKFYCIFIGQANSAFNPCIYFVLCKEYRKGLCQILSLPCCGKERSIAERISRPLSLSLTLRAKPDCTGLRIKPTRQAKSPQRKGKEGSVVNSNGWNERAVTGLNSVFCEITL